MRTVSRRVRRPPATVLVAVLLVTALLTAACSASAGPASDDASQSFSAPPGASAGDLVGSPIPTDAYISLRRIVDRTVRFRYLSTDPVSGALVPVSAAVFVPRGCVRSNRTSFSACGTETSRSPHLRNAIT